MKQKRQNAVPEGPKQIVHFEGRKVPVIYVFRINDRLHKDCLKIGKTSMEIGNMSNKDALELQPNCPLLNDAANRRIAQYTKTAAVEYELLYTESALYVETIDGKSRITCFNDTDVHSVLLRSGVERKRFASSTKMGREWFKTDKDTAIRAIKRVKEGRAALDASEVTQGHSPIAFRPEQKSAINKTIKRFRKDSAQMLWNAKMRFGKTLSALQVVKEMKFDRTLILTHRPVVDEGWYEDFSKIFYDTPEYRYGSRTKGETFEDLERATKERKKYIYFASIQDMRGSETVGGRYGKNSGIFNAKWDLLIIDEAHEGTQTALGKRVAEKLRKEKTRILYLSGTPFNLLEEFNENEIFTWDYVMEQRAKERWDVEHFGDPNPYACLPKLHILTYNLGDLFNRYADETLAFNFREFFKTNEDGSFKHRDDVQSFLDLLCKNDDASHYPFANNEYRAIFRHTLWMVPGVKEARALSALLKEHSIFQNFNIANVAGDGDEDEENANALSMVEEAIGDDPDDAHSITISCGRLTTGVSVKAWTGVLMLAGSYNTAASTYMQTIFRVQTPATINGRTKEDCYVFDFAPDRTLQVLATVPRVSTKAGKTTESQKAALGEFLNYCPVIAISGGRMEGLDVTRMLEELKKAYVERSIRNGFEDSCLYNDELLKLNAIEIKEFNDLKGIIGKTKSTKAPGFIDVNNQGLTEEEYAEKGKLDKKKRKEGLTVEEKARLEELRKKKQVKDDAISILRGISIRMPLLIYGADIQNEDKDLTIDNFTTLVDDQSWEEFMPDGVTKEVFAKFKKYYDPEIFSAAGKRIRAMTRAADRLSIEERISRIASIFAPFRNPDKETVLTPWRVVNMHMSDTLGGYSFFNDDFSQELDAPHYVDQGKITQTLFAPNGRLLEINSKTGLYPLYLTYSLYRQRLQNLKRINKSPETLEQHLKIWDEAIRENLFIVCKTPMAKAITCRTLIGFRKVRVNTQYFEDLNNQITDRKTQFVEQATDMKTWKKGANGPIKFNAIVGNPPYQLNDGKGAAADAANPLYDDFFRATKAIRPDYISLIMPSRWMVGGRPKLKSFRKEMMADHHFIFFRDFEDAAACFPGQHIDSGVCYFLWSASHDGQVRYRYQSTAGVSTETMRFLSDGGKPIVIRDMSPCRISLIEKTSAGERFDTIVSTTKPYGIRKDLFNNLEKYKAAGGSESPHADSVLIWGVKGKKGAAKRKQCYVNRSAVCKNEETIDKYKLFFTTSYTTGAINPPEIILADPGTVCTETFLLVGPFKTKAERDNCHSYMNTRIFKVLLSFGKGTMQVNQSTFSFIPLVDFSQKWTDEKLAKLFKLSPEEISYVDSLFP